MAATRDIRRLDATPAAAPAPEAELAATEAG
jgi:hypothetical protein